MNLVYLSLCVAFAMILPTKFRFNPALNFGEDIVYGFQDGCYGGHLGKQNGTITAILNLNVAWIHTTKCSM